MKRPISLIATASLFFAAVSCPIISAEKTTVQAQEANLDSAKAYYNRGLSYAEKAEKILRQLP